MDLARARYLVSGRGRNALAALPAGLAELPLNSLAASLRRDFAAGEAAALGEQVTLRARAADRHGSDRGLLLTAEGLEMMTHPAVARRRASRLAALGLPVIDLTCGLGGDLLACAEAGARAVGLERDYATALLAAANVPRAAVMRGDALRAPFELAKAVVVIDPSRRAGGSRRFDPRAFTPPWDAAVSLLSEAGGGVLKAPPGIDHHHFPAGSEVEWVQLGRSLREAAVWMGHDAEPGLRRAVWLPSGAEIDSSCEEADAAPSVPRGFVFDPESGVTNAGLVRHLAFRLGASLMDSKVAYLTADAPAEDPLAVAFEVIETLPFSLARLRERLRALGLKADEIRRRAFPVEPDEMRRLLGPMDGEPITLLCTTLAGRRTVFIVRRVKPNIA